ncbi:uncharacterized protein LOC108631331 [Ceratina calcarata]|uniref:Uncharacterized protein LOC108631331 n=1 Tax=Ceratina calcarata TaxID=156304 RepID=A0AAJ7JD54_9HYME|nr:uncharacterized protein LOC108631331 [Ceratina calcarata]
MFENSNFNMDKFVHKFIQNLSLTTESRVYRKFSKITFSRLVDKPHRIKQLLLHSTEKMKEISMPQNLDLSNEKHIEYFMEKYTGLCDKFTYLNNSRILDSHLRNINMKILQKIKIKKRHNEGVKKGEFKTSNRKLRINVSSKLSNLKKNLSSSVVYREKCNNVHNCEEDAPRTSPKLVSHTPTFNNFKHGNILEINTEEKSVKHDLVNDIINVAKLEIEMTEKFLSFCIRDKEFIKKNVQVTLHIEKNLKRDPNAREQVEYNQVLCHHAILCLIEPSKKGVVLMEDDLSVVVQKYLSHGYKYHFEFQRNTRDCYTALLILSRWAKVLVRHTNTTLMHTICGILGCDAQNILVMYNPEGK